MSFYYIVTSRWILNAHGWHKMQHCQEFPSKPLTGQLSLLRNTTLHHCVWHKICYKTSCYLSSSQKNTYPTVVFTFHRASASAFLDSSCPTCGAMVQVFLRVWMMIGGMRAKPLRDRGETGEQGPRKRRWRSTFQKGQPSWKKTLTWNGTCWVSAHIVAIRDVGRRWPHTWISYPWASLLTPANTRILASLLANWHYITYLQNVYI